MVNDRNSFDDFFVGFPIVVNINNDVETYMTLEDLFSHPCVYLRGLPPLLSSASLVQTLPTHFHYHIFFLPSSRVFSFPFSASARHNDYLLMRGNKFCRFVLTVLRYSSALALSSLASVQADTLSRGELLRDFSSHVSSKAVSINYLFFSRSLIRHVARMLIHPVFADPPFSVAN